MRYKQGDKVRIKTWKQMKKEYGVDNCGYIPMRWGFIREMENYLNDAFPDRILTIREVEEDSYEMKGNDWRWMDEMIEGLSADEYLKRPVVTRFELLDFED